MLLGKLEKNSEEYCMMARRRRKYAVPGVEQG
jgi:hypothetical protein